MTQYLLPMELPRVEVALRDAAQGGTESRWVAALALGRARGDHAEEAIAALVRLADDPVKEVRVQGIEGLAEQARGGAAVPADPIDRAMRSGHPEVRCAALEACVDILKSPEEAIAGLTDDADPSVRATAARVLGVIRAQDRISALAALLDDPHEPVRAEAALSLAAMGNAASQRTLINILQHRGDLALDAAIALGELGQGEAAEELHAVLTRWTTSRDLKGAAAAAMARCGDARGERFLANMLASRRQSTRMAALSALTRLPVPRVAAAVGQMMHNKEEIEVSSAICALSSIGRVDARTARKQLEPHRKHLEGELLQELNEALDLLAERSPDR